MAKLSKKELRAPDQVWQASAQTFRWLQSNWIVALIVVGLGFIFLVATLYVQQVQTRTEAEAQAVYGEVASLFEQWLLAEPSAQSSIEDRINAQLEILSTSYPETDSNHLASLYRARIKMQKAQVEESLADFDHLIDALPKENSALGLYPQAMAFENLGRWEQALANYNKILEDSTDVQYRKWALLGKARSLTELENTSEARSTYDQFLNEFASAPEAALARGFRARLGNN